jgi:hypothetical protein
MLGNRRIKYFHKCIVEYIDIAGLHAREYED